MPKKKTRKSSKTDQVNGSSIMVSDISNSQILPLATSSPRASKFFDITQEDVEEVATSLKNDFKTKQEQTFEEETTKLLAVEKELSGNSVATASDLKELKKIFTSLKNISANGTRNFNRRTRATVENVSALPAIDEEDSPGKNFDNDDLKENDLPTSSFPDSTKTGKAEKKLRIVSDKSEDGDNNVFKKPTGRGKRTLKNSHLANGFQTPKTKTKYNVAVVTPGPNSHRPVNIFRQPNPGEMAISMTGSPLLIANNNIGNNAPQISIPLSDGRVMTVVADEGLDPEMSFCSDIDTETRERLEILQKLLSKKTRNIRD